MSRETFYKAIRTYIPPCMQYKLPKEHQGYYKPFELKFKNVIKSKFVQVIECASGSDHKFRQKGKYDIGVAGNKNYMVGNPINGVIIHNSPEYEPGGEALKFYSSVRLQSRPRAVPSGWDQGVTDTGNKTSEFGQERSVVGRGKDKYAYIYIKNTKNKVGTPLLGTWMRIWYSDGNSRPHGYDPVFDTFTYLKMTGRIAGKRKDKRGFKILLDVPELKGKAFTWEEFKLLIVASEFPKMKIFVPAKKDKLEERIVSEYALSHFKFKGKIPDLRKALFKEVKSGECYNLVNNSTSADDDDEDIEE